MSLNVESKELVQRINLVPKLCIVSAMSSSNPGAEVPEAAKTSPADKIIQLVKEIQEELRAENNTNHAVKSCLRGIILTAREHHKQLSNAFVGTIDRLESSLSSLALPLYGVVIDGVRINTVDLDHPEGTIDELQKQNHRVLHGREIKRLRWLQKPRKGKQYASLVMEFATPEDANVVINTNELFWQNETRRVRRVVRSATINQCFKCNKYGHRSTQCRNPETCGFCAEQHTTAACPSRDVPAKASCANCRKKHPAWSLDCDLRKQEKTKIRDRISRAEKYWREPTALVNVSPGPSSAPTNSSAITTAKTSKAAAAGQKRPLAEKTDNDTNSAPKKLTKSAMAAKKLAEETAATTTTETAIDGIENDENVEEEEVSNLSRVGASSIGMELRPKNKRRPIKAWTSQTIRTLSNAGRPIFPSIAAQYAKVI